MKTILEKTLKAFVLLLCFIAMIAVTRYLYLEEQGNFHAITYDEAYRSAQLDQDELEYYLTKFKIRSIINLRGKSASAWYLTETEISKNMNVRHFDFKLKADRSPPARRIDELLNLFVSAPRPVLIHCKAGADRSGLASALWKLVIDKQPKSLAKKQLSLRYGHVPFGPTQVIDRFFEEWTGTKNN